MKPSIFTLVLAAGLSGQAFAQGTPSGTEHDAHHPQSLQNVCLTGTVCMAALTGGLLISAIIFAKTFWLH